MAYKKLNKKTVKIMFNAPEEINNRYIELASQNGLSRSSMILLAMKWYLDYSDTLATMPQLVKSIELLQKSNNK